MLVLCIIFLLKRTGTLAGRLVLVLLMYVYTIYTRGMLSTWMINSRLPSNKPRLPARVPTHALDAKWLPNAYCHLSLPNDSPIKCLSVLRYTAVYRDFNRNNLLHWSTIESLFVVRQQTGPTKTGFWYQLSWEPGSITPFSISSLTFCKSVVPLVYCKEPTLQKRERKSIF